MKFDYEGARKAGFSDEKIAVFLAQEQGFDLEGAYAAGLGPDKVVAFLTSSIHTKPADRNAFALANDTVIEAGNAAAGLVKAGVDLVAPGSAPSEAIEGFIKSGQEKQSDWKKDQRRRLAEELQNAEGELDKAGIYAKHALAEDPLGTVGQVVGNIGPFGAAGKAMQGLSAAKQTAGMMGLAGGLTAGEVRGNIYEKISATPDSVLAEQSPEYAALREQGLSEKQAKHELGASLIRHLPEVAAAGAIGALGGKYGMEGMMAGVAPKFGGRLMSGAVGVADEATQGAVEQLATNYGVQRTLPEQKLMEDVALNATAEGILGFGAIARPTARTEAQHIQADAPDALPEQILAAPGDTQAPVVDDVSLVMETLAQAPDVDTAISTALELASAPISLPEPIPAPADVPTFGAADTQASQPIPFSAQMRPSGELVLEGDGAEEFVRSVAPDAPVLRRRDGSLVVSARFAEQVHQAAQQYTPQSPAPQIQGLASLTLTDRPTGTLEVSGPDARELITQLVPGESVQQRKDGSVIVGLKYAEAVRQAVAEVTGGEIQAAPVTMVDPTVPVASAEVAELVEESPLQAYAAEAEPLSLDEAQTVLHEARAAGYDGHAVIEHPAGRGYIAVPKDWLSDEQLKAAEALQPAPAAIPAAQTSPMESAQLGEEGQHAPASTIAQPESGAPAEIEAQPVAPEQSNEPADSVSPIEEQQRAAVTPPKVLQDFGEKIGGSRKDRWRERGLSVEDLAEMSAGEAATHVSKDAVWPKLDYAKLVTDGMEPSAAALLKIIRDRMAAAPRKDTAEGRRAYVEVVSAIREAAREAKTEADIQALAGKITRALGIPEQMGLIERNRPEVRAALEKLWSTYKGRSNPLSVSYSDQRKAKQMLAESWPHAKKERTKTAGRDTREEPSRPHLDDLERTGEDVRAGQDITPQQLAETFGFRGIEFGNWVAGDERQRAVNMAFEALQDLAGVLQVPPKALSLNGTLGVAFGARGGGKHSAHYEPSKLVINLTKLSGAGSLAHEWAHALDHYLGELNRPDAYAGKARGASGWMEQKRNTENLRPELSAALDKVMEALFRREKSHAEAVREVELEVERRQADVARGEERLAKEGLSDTERKSWQEWLDHSKTRLSLTQAKLAKLRDEPRPAEGYGSVQSSFYQQGRALSGKSEKGYWTRPTEMFARAFESFVFDQVRADGRVSDYLVHGVEADRYADQTRYKGNPYPVGAEREAIDGAFAELVQTLETRETEKGVALYKRGEKGFSQDKVDGVVFFKAAAGEPLNSLLDTIIVWSTSPLNQELARLFKAKYFTTEVRIGEDEVLDSQGRHALGSFNADQNVIELYTDYAAERVLIHELTHAATVQALAGDSPASTAMRSLYRHVKKELGQENHYGLEDVYEFVAEAFSNPRFQEALKQIPVNPASKLRKLYNAWAKFVATVRQILGLTVEQETALGKALELGVRLMHEPSEAALQRGKALYYSKTQGESAAGLSVKEWITHQLANHRGWALGALTRDQIADIYGRDNPEVAEFDRVVQEMDQARNVAAEQADVIIERWRGLASDEADRLADVMHQATLKQFDPDQKRTPETFEEADIRKAWQELSPEAKQLYRDVRDTYTATLVKLRNGLAKRAEYAGEAGKRIAAAIRLQFDKYLAEGPYFPLARFGDLLLIADKGQDRIVESFESSAAREKRARVLRAKGWSVKQTAKKTYSAASDGPAGEFVGKVLKLVDGLEIDAQEKTGLMDSLNQLAIASLPDQSARKHFMHRKGTPGFSSDAMRAFASSMQHVAHHTARVLYSDDLTFLLTALNKRITEARGDVDLTEQQQVANELAKRLELILNPNTHPVTAALGQAGFVMSLGGSIASGLTNMTQTPLVTYPWLGAKFGFTKAAAALTKASTDYFGGKWEKWSGFVLKDNPALTADERRALGELEDDGLINLTQAQDLAGTANTDKASSKKAFAINRAMKIVGWTFHTPEVFNRQVSALAAYRLSRDLGEDHGRAVERARETLRRTHFDYSASNRARWMAGNFTRVVTMFKQYSQNMTYLLWRNAYLALQGESLEVKHEARRLLLGLGTMHFAAAGALGLPLGVFGVSQLLALLAMGMGDDDEPWDWEVEFRNMLADVFGKAGGEAIAHGPMRALLGVDLASRVGLGDLWVRAPMKEAEGRDLVEAWMLTLLGPVAGYAGNLGTAAKAFDEGKYGRGLEAMLPKFIANPIKAIRYETEGVKSWRGDDLKVKLDGEDIFATAIGFQPAQLAEMYEGRAAIKGKEAKLQARREELTNMWVSARIAEDAEGVREATEQIQGFNQKHHSMAITGGALSRSLLAKRRNAKLIEDGVYLPKKHKDLRAEGRFAHVDR